MRHLGTAVRVHVPDTQRTVSYRYFLIEEVGGCEQHIYTMW